MDVIKRNGEIVDFETNKIVDAIYAASQEVGKNNRDRARDLADKAAGEVRAMFDGEVEVEQIQDVVEDVLWDNGYSDIAKAYIVYRDHQKEKREEKQSVLGKDSLDEVDKQFSLNALQVLARRYLQKDGDGNIEETPKELFERVATAVTIPDLLYDPEIFEKEGAYGSSTERRLARLFRDEDEIIEGYDLSIGDHELNKWHKKELGELYIRLSKNNQMKVEFDQVLRMLEGDQLDHHEENWQDYFNMMANQEFLPNSPTLMNMGRPLGAGSACFKGDTLVETKSGVKEIQEIEKGDMVLTHKGRYKSVTKTMERIDQTYTIKVNKLPELEVTADHPFLTKSGWKEVQELTEKEDYLQIGRPDLDVVQHTIRFDGPTKDGWVEAKRKANEGSDIDRLPDNTSPIKNNVKVDEDVAWLIGKYLADGCVSDLYDIRITSNDDTAGQRYAEKSKRILKERFGINAYIEENSPSTRKGDSWLTARAHSKALAQWIEDNLGTSFDTKTIPLWAHQLPEKQREALLNGINDGDGTPCNHTQTRIVVSNPTLAFGIFQLAFSLGYKPNLNKVHKPEYATTQPWGVSYGENYNHGMVDMVNDQVYYRLQSIERNDREENVYNLEVTDDHTYIAHGVVAHNCFVLPIEDDLGDIMQTASEAAQIFQSGGGVGVNFSNLRPKGDVVGSVHGVSSGPVSFMTIIDTVTDVVSQAGLRKGANMGIIDANHPDVKNFIQAKEGDNDKLENYNISVGTDTDFWEAFENDHELELVNPRNGEVWDTVNPKELLKQIAHSSWASADPGVVFFDNANENNPLEPAMGRLDSTNPCGEQLLYEYGSCNLGAVNLESCVKNGEFDWEKYDDLIRKGTRFLDNILSINNFPLDEIEEQSLKTRRVGLGVMGLANTLYRLEVPYDSKEGYDLMDRMAETHTYTAMGESVDIAKERGPFPAFEESTYPEGGLPVDTDNLDVERRQKWEWLADQIQTHGIRNSLHTTVAPTGSRSLIADTSSGIEPEFALAYDKQVSVGNFYQENDVLADKLKEAGIYSKNLLKKVVDNYGTVSGLNEVPDKLQDVFTTAMEIHYLDHIMAQATWQQWIDASISKTINMPNNTSPSDVYRAYIFAHEQGAKGVTIYRDGSKEQQVLNLDREDARDLVPEPSNHAEMEAMALSMISDVDEVENAFRDFEGNDTDENSTECPECGSTNLVPQDGCLKCGDCGTSLCTGM